MASSKVPTKTLRVLEGHTGAVGAVVFNSKGEYCVSGGYDKLVRLWNPHNGKLIKVYKGHGYYIDSVAVSSDNAQIASAGGDKTPFVWDVETGNVVRKLKGHDYRLHCVRYSKDSAVLVTSSMDKTVKCWDMRSRSFEPIQTMEEAKDSVMSLSVGAYEIVTGSVDGCVRVYDLRLGQLRTDTVGGDENVLLVSSLDSTLRLLDKDDGSLYQSYKGHKNEMYPVQSVFSNDDAHVLSGSEDGKLCVWSLEDGKLVHSIQAHQGRLGAIAYHPTQHMLLTGSNDKSIKVWGPADAPAAAASS